MTSLKKLFNKVNSLPPKSRKITWSVIALALLFIIFGLIFGFVAFKNAMIAEYMAHYKMPPMTVAVAQVKAQTWHPKIDSIGRAEAVQGSKISPQVTGIVSKIYFQSGQMIKAGAPLIHLSSSSAEAELARAKAMLKLAELDFERQSKLYRDKVVSQSDYDKSKAALEEDQANVQHYKSSLAHKTILAPYDGKLGIRKVSLGQYLSPGDAITHLQQLAPIFVNYYVPEQYIGELKVGQPVDVMVDAYPAKQFKGEITAIDARVSRATKSIEVQATFQNASHKLYPGMYVQVATILPEQKQVMTIPQEAIDYNIYGDAVYVLSPIKQSAGKAKPVSPQKSKSSPAVYIAHKMYVTLGEAQGNQVPVIKGLKVGQKVVVEGQIKLHDNTPVTIVPRTS